MVISAEKWRKSIITTTTTYNISTYLTLYLFCSYWAPLNLYQPVLDLSLWNHLGGRVGGWVFSTCKIWNVFLKPSKSLRVFLLFWQFFTDNGHQFHYGMTSVHIIIGIGVIYIYLTSQYDTRMSNIHRNPCSSILYGAICQQWDT